MKLRSSVLVVISALALLAAPAAGYAAGSGGGGGSGGGSGGGGSGSGGGNGGGSGGGSGSGGGGDQRDVKVCKKGHVYDKKMRKCLAQEAVLLPDSELIEQAWALARQSDFEAGRLLFGLVADKDAPEVLNGLGYTNRKLGYFAVAIDYYKRAIASDPDYVEAREYLGEGYVTLGEMDKAREQLAEIQKRCPSTCEAYEDLKDAIDTAEKAASVQ